MSELRSDHGDVETVFTMLADDRCWYVLRCLTEHETPISLADLATEVAIREHGTRPADIPAADTKQIHVTLYHKYVPKLAAAGFVTYDSDRNRVDTVESFDADIPAILEAVSRATDAR
ncbi:hypothetical protein [Natrialba sp. PRR66]|uniref:DUF7344 domain-containing protein n=1 Tax=Natrialba sp. PRR66 TaxID=3098146 RepID=UPI002B1D930A|nr:hypothetical protein [Natrialba sp. PRR66]